MKISCEAFGTTAEGENIDLYTLKSPAGDSVGIINFGATVQSFQVHDRQGQIADIVLGYDNVQGYENDPFYFGGIVGRFANRIAGGKFEIDGQVYNLAMNGGDHSLHGGIKGFNKVVWDAEPFEINGDVGVKMTYVSRDGEEGYPGELKTTVVYSFNEENELKILIEAQTDKETPVNLTNHSYFNLKGHGRGDVLDHQVKINSDYFTPYDSSMIVTGELTAVKDTPLDFNTITSIGERLQDDYPALKLGRGYDQNYAVRRMDESLIEVAQVYEPESGRFMDVFSTEPALQFYIGNFLDGIEGKDGEKYPVRSGLCLETQHFPDSPNKPNFPSTFLKPGQILKSQTVYRLSVK